MSTLFVDRGGTSTKVWCLSSPNVSVGDPLFCKFGFPTETFGNDGHSGTTAFPSELPQLISHLKKYLRSLPEMPERALVGSRSVWTKAERAALKKKLRFLAKDVVVMSDIELAHWLAFENREGIALNAGTGSIAFGRNKKGASARSGGLGPLIGDEGSAFWVGREYLKRTYQWKRLRTWSKEKDGVRKISGYAKNVFRSSSVLSREIQADAINHLIDLITQVQSILKIKKPTPLVLRGGLFNDSRFKKEFIRRCGRPFTLRLRK